MKHGMFIICMLFLISTSQGAPRSRDVYEETYYQNVKHRLSHHKSRSSAFGALTSFEQSLYVDALWDVVEEGGENLLNEAGSYEFFHYELSERLRVAILRLKYQHLTSLPPELVDELRIELRKKTVELKILYHIASYETELQNAGHYELINLAKIHSAYKDIAESENFVTPLSDEVVADLFYQAPDVSNYMNGEYQQSSKVFMFCRTNRLYPCLMIMKDKHGNAVRDENGSLWSHPSLASSARGLPSHVRNGNTPSGVYTIDSVMPVADQRISFGKFRRMIINFIPSSNEEILLRTLLPKSSHLEQWWRPSVIARDVGRNLFRIHGTGKRNDDANTPYFPFVRTSGCISQRENTYNDRTYIDQRELLDKMMASLDLERNYSNEVKIKAILYLIEIDDLPRPVDLDDLNLRGIN